MDESEEYSSRDDGYSDQVRFRRGKKRQIERGFGGQLYEYRGSSADEDESEMEEASFGEIEEEEYRTLKIGEQEDEEEL